MEADGRANIMVVIATHSAGFELDDDFSRLDLQKVHAIVSSQFWALGTSYESMVTRTKNAWSFGLYSAASNELVGFMRLVTDRISFAYLSDVVIDEPLRGQGLGQFMITTVFGLAEVEQCKGYLFTGSERRCQYYERLANFETIAQRPRPGGAVRYCMERLPDAEQPFHRSSRSKQLYHGAAVASSRSTGMHGAIASLQLKAVCWSLTPWLCTFVAGIAAGAALSVCGSKWRARH